ncbi:MAG: type II secretion system protein GspL, partial [Pseudomonadota bacterium]|nr:type II secretion system protein GspL [Pseudomonadota bacterium]
MDKQSELQIDAMQCKFDLAGKLWLKLNNADWQEAAFVLQSQSDESAIKKAMTKVKVVWVPTEQVSLMQQFVPGKRKQDWMTALPFALEESLSEPVEGLHFVALNRDAEGLVSVAIVSKERMQDWVDQLQSFGLAHALLVADCFQVTVSQKASEEAQQ